MTTFSITDCSNDSQLQDFINQASDGDTIIFACSGTVTLTKPLIIKRKGLTTLGLTLDSNGEAVVLDGGKQMGVLLVEDMQLALKGLTLANGKAEHGGGLFNTGGEVTMSHCTFSGNIASNSGGGLYNKKGKVTVSHCTFSGNSAKHGGGLLNEGTAIITNCTFSGNDASAWAGGLYNNFGEMTVSFSTFVNNTASVAGGWAGIGSFSMSATIVANNTARYSSSQNGSGQITSLGFNLESGTDCGFTTLPTDQQNTDPKFDPKGMQSHGGPTQTFALQAGSPARGAVTDATLCPDTDQRGWLRPEGLTSCDIGAYQSSYLAPPPPLPLSARTQARP